jgi:hypothetical protein
VTQACGSRVETQQVDHVAQGSYPKLLVVRGALPPTEGIVPFASNSRGAPLMMKVVCLLSVPRYTMKLSQLGC